MPLIVRAHDKDSSIELIEEALGGQEPTTTSGASSNYVVVGDEIEVEDQEGFLRGHGTKTLPDGRLVATLCGVVQRVNKLIYVRPLKSRYTAEQGDVVIGRVSEVAVKRWKVDLKSRQEAGLLLSAVNLPGGIQRRRNAEDELNMRTLFIEGDLISAEVQQVNSEGSVALHTRSSKYGKLKMGQLVVVPANVVKRQKQHFVSFETIGVHVILGCNGLIWVSPLLPPSAQERQQAEEKERGGRKGDDMEVEGGESSSFSAAAVTRAQVEAATRVANCIRALSSLYFLIYPATILDAYEISIERGVGLQEMLTQHDFLLHLVKSEASRRGGAES